MKLRKLAITLFICSCVSCDYKSNSNCYYVLESSPIKTCFIVFNEKFDQCYYGNNTKQHYGYARFEDNKYYNSNYYVGYLKDYRTLILEDTSSIDILDVGEYKLSSFVYSGGWKE